MAAEHLAAPRMSLAPSRREEFAARSPRFVDGHRRLGPRLERCASDAIAGPSSDVWPAGWLAR
eukprot:1234967-Alexandrium_andersonii.AAC.2